MKDGLWHLVGQVWVQDHWTNGALHVWKLGHSFRWRATWKHLHAEGWCNTERAAKMIAVRTGAALADGAEIDKQTIDG